MKLFGWKAAGRVEARPALSRSGMAPVALGEWPQSYEAQVRAAYLGNAIAQRAVKLVAEGVGGAPVAASDARLAGLVAAPSGGQRLGETLAAYLLLHGNAYAMRGSDPRAVSELLDASGLVRVCRAAPGDLLLCASGPGQLHLAIVSESGVIHADAMLRRVVERPGVVPWPVLGCWRTRLSGD